MRCQNCQVDLPESYDRCPLCGEPASGEPSVLKHIAEAPYPPHPEKAPKPKRKIITNETVLLAATIVCIVFCVIGGIRTWALLAPLIFFVLNIYFFICGLKEQGRLLHAAVLLLATAGAELVLLLLALILRHAYHTTLFLLVITIALLIILYAVRSERFTSQMKAFFHL